MGKPNFNFQKRQKELAKKKKNEEKRLRKIGKKPGEGSDPADAEEKTGNSELQPEGSVRETGETEASRQDEKGTA